MRLTAQTRWWQNYFWIFIRTEVIKEKPILLMQYNDFQQSRFNTEEAVVTQPRNLAVPLELRESVCIFYNKKNAAIKRFL